MNDHISSVRRVSRVHYFRNKFLLLVAVLCFVLGLAGCAKASRRDAKNPSLALKSPDGKIVLGVLVHGRLAYTVNVDGRPVLNPSRLGLNQHDGTEFGRDMELVKATRSEVDSTWENRFGKRRQVRDQQNELRLELREKSASRSFEVVFGAFNDGIGFRHVLPAQAGMETFIVEQERTEFAFTDNHPCFAGAQAHAAVYALSGRAG